MKGIGDSVLIVIQIGAMAVAMDFEKSVFHNSYDFDQLQPQILGNIGLKQINKFEQWL